MPKAAAGDAKAAKVVIVSIEKMLQKIAIM